MSSVLTITNLEALGADTYTSSTRDIGRLMRLTKGEEGACGDLVIADPTMYSLFNQPHFQRSWLEWATVANDFFGVEVRMRAFFEDDHMSERSFGRDAHPPAIVVSLFGKHFFDSYDTTDEAWLSMFQKLENINVDHWEPLPGQPLQAHLTARHPQHVKRRQHGPEFIMLMTGSPGKLVAERFPLSLSARRRQRRNKSEELM